MKLIAVASIHATLALFESARMLAYGSIYSSTSKVVSNMWINYDAPVFFREIKRTGNLRIIKK